MSSLYCVHNVSFNCFLFLRRVCTRYSCKHFISIPYYCITRLGMRFIIMFEKNDYLNFFRANVLECLIRPHYLVWGLVYFYQQTSTNTFTSKSGECPETSKFTIFMMSVIFRIKHFNNVLNWLCENVKKCDSLMASNNNVLIPWYYIKKRKIFVFGRHIEIINKLMHSIFSRFQ